MSKLKSYPSDEKDSTHSDCEDLANRNRISFVKNICNLIETNLLKQNKNNNNNIPDDDLDDKSNRDLKKKLKIKQHLDILKNYEGIYQNSY